MGRTRIKICGISRVEDALAAARQGADAIGLVFCPEAKRNIARERAREILAALPPFVTPVGLFVDEPPQIILDTAAELNLTHVQLHGGEPPEEVEELLGLRIIKAIRVARDTILKDLKRWREAIDRRHLTNLAGFVLESAGQHVGGSGVVNDWALVRELQSQGQFDGLPAIIAAGGLTPESVGGVVRDIHPWAVDVSSGVEAQPGQKSEDQIAAFIRAVREAD